jgi:bacillithiol system protein YtxJ
MPLDPLSRTDALAADAGALLARHSVHVIYKHSPYCSLSFVAHEHVRRYVDAPDALPVTLVDVVNQRAMSDALEQVTGVRHESPQLLLVRGGVVQWHTSHRGVTAPALTGAAQAAATVGGG